MLQIVLVLSLSAHLLLVDIAMAGPLVCVWLAWRATRRADPMAGRAAIALARISIGALVGGIVIGGVLLAIHGWMGDGAYFSALGAVPVSRLWFGCAELLFSLVCMSAYLALWDRWKQRPGAHRLLAIAAASNLLLHFPALFAIVSVLSTRGELVGQTLDGAGYRRMLIDGEILSRVAHVWLAAFAVTGVLLMVLARRLAVAEGQAAAGQRLIQRGAWLGLVPSLLQIPAGLWLAWQMPDTAREPLFGSDPLATGLFMVSLLLALVLIHTLAAVALGDHEPRNIGRSMALLVILILLMVGTRLRLHTNAAAEHGGSSLPGSARPGTG